MPETPMCAQRWAEVEFAKVPSLWAAAGSARRRVRRAREGRSGAESAPACMLLCLVVDDGSLLNEFAMMWELRQRFRCTSLSSNRLPATYRTSTRPTSSKPFPELEISLVHL